MGPDLLQRHRSLRVLVGLLIIVVAFYIIGVVWNVLAGFGDIILIFFLSWVVTFILEPVTKFLQRRGFSRILAVSLVFAALLIVISGAIVLSAYAIAAQVTHIAQLVQQSISGGRLDSLAAQATKLLIRAGVAPATAHQLIGQATTQIPSKAGDLSNAAVSSAEGLVSSVLAIIFDASIVLILAFYLMLDGGRLWETTVRKLPPVFLPDIRLFQRHVAEIFGGFFRAQLITAVLYAIATYLVLLPLGQANGGFIAAMLAGVIIILPFIGPFLSIIPPALLVILQTPQNHIVIYLIILVVGLGAAQHIVINLLGPRIFGTSMGVDPVVLFIVLLLGAKEGGVWGAFFAGPVAAVIYAMIETFYDRFAATSPLFKKEPAPEVIVTPQVEVPRSVRHRRMHPVRHRLTHVAEDLKATITRSAKPGEQGQAPSDEEEPRAKTQRVDLPAELIPLDDSERQERPPDTVVLPDGTWRRIDPEAVARREREEAEQMERMRRAGLGNTPNGHGSGGNGSGGNAGSPGDTDTSDGSGRDEGTATAGRRHGPPRV